ncbi:hypothetical protein [Sphingomonas sp. PAMC 26617]|uniref:hypothetical protein n=1 Tax=Sphingomonas sp. PAMC 26617 TaxID=1112216 RepID=UPI00028A2111|nr:hypothetical protein [Sphingomonas sp. PAMC 26617]
MPIEDLLSDDESRQIEAARLVELARDLLTGEREQVIKANLDHALLELARFGDNVRSSIRRTANQPSGDAFS